jgi:hypothetical protein
MMQPGGFDFLGYHFEGRSRTPRKKSLEKFKNTIRELPHATTGKAWRGSLSDYVQRCGVGSTTSSTAGDGSSQLWMAGSVAGCAASYAGAKAGVAKGVAVITSVGQTSTLLT